MAEPTRRNNLSNLFNPDEVDGERAHFKEHLPLARRASRDELIAAADAYFDGIEANDGSRIPVADSCLRIENGVQTVRREVTGGGFAEGFGGGQLGVAAQISSGRYEYIAAIRDRRYLCDEERGLVLAVAFFDHPGKLTAVHVKGTGVVELPPATWRPSSVPVFEVFKVTGGLIRAIEAVLGVLPYGMRPGWTDRDAHLAKRCMAYLGPDGSASEPPAGFGARPVAREVARSGDR